MIVTTGKIVKIQIGKYRLERNPDTLGVCLRNSVTGEQIYLPCKPEAAKEIAKAYLLIAGKNSDFQNEEIK